MFLHVLVFLGVHHLWIHISWWPLCWQLLRKGKQIVLLPNRGKKSVFTFTHSCLQNFQLLTQVWSIWRVRWKGDWWNTRFPFCILIAALMGIYQRRSAEVKWAVTWVVSLNWTSRIQSPLKWTRKIYKDLKELKPGESDCYKMLPIPQCQILIRGPEMCFAFSLQKTCGQVTCCPDNISISARVNYTQKGSRETVGVNQGSFSDLSRGIQISTTADEAWRKSFWNALILKLVSESKVDNKNQTTHTQAVLFIRRNNNILDWMHDL